MKKIRRLANFFLKQTEAEFFPVAHFLLLNKLTNSRQKLLTGSKLQTKYLILQVE